MPSDVPQLITGSDCGLDVNKPPMSVLFGSIKARRDAFVHCEPGPQPSDRGHIKEVLFHQVPGELVEETVDLTFQIIRHLWKHVHNTDGPRWLCDVRESRVRRMNLRLSPPYDAT
jgi:hypothetical protein